MERGLKAKEYEMESINTPNQSRTPLSSELETTNRLEESTPFTNDPFHQFLLTFEKYSNSLDFSMTLPKGMCMLHPKKPLRVINFTRA